MCPVWSWDVGGGKKDRKEGGFWPQPTYASSMPRCKNILPNLWVLEEFLVDYKKDFVG